jgi:hypothetical protein
MSTDKENNPNIESNRKREERDAIDASHGEDRIEIEKREAEGLNDMDKFAPMDGDLGDESEDRGDLPLQDRINRNRYDPAMGVGNPEHKSKNVRPEGMHKTYAGNSGITSHEGDSYVDEDGNKKIAPEKRENQDEVQNPGNKKD